MYRKLRIIRVVVSLAVLSLVVAGIIWPDGTVGALAMRYARLQFVPAIMTGAVVWIVFWILFTLIFGRLYCSLACPLGTLQDIIARLSRRLLRKPLPYSFSQGSTATRIVAAVVLFEAICLGATTLVSYLDPYSDFVRLFSVFSAFSLSGIIVAFVILAVTVSLSWRQGRLLCNTLCPVGATLSLVSKASQLRFDINPDVCIHCGRCESRCKSRCIDSDRSVIDNSRCVVCFDCVSVCPTGALTWRRGRHKLQWPLLQKIQRTPAAACPSPPCAQCSARKNIPHHLNNETISRPASAHPDGRR